ncbi:MAG: hypothetical protein JKY08_00400 [Flavobacteriaceae bacterium]|nr:hypothetical protein [Flavobacteriaceae bacterium]
MSKNHVSLFLFIIISVINVHGQENTVRLKGKVLHQNNGVPFITVLNRQSNKGEITHGSGVFSLSVQQGDSIQFSSLEYINRVIVISDYHIKNKILYVYLEPLVNELNEVFLDKKIRLDFSDLYVAKNTQLDIDEIDLRKPPDAAKLTSAHQVTFINFIAIIQLFTKNIRKKTKEKKALFNHEEKAKIIFLDNIMELYGANYLQEQLKIPAHKTHLFIEYCNDKGLSNLYRSEPIMILDFLYNHSVDFNNLNK